MGVIVHSGKGVGQGHYFTFLNPHLEGEWFCFDDEIVTRVCLNDTITNQIYYAYFK